MHPLPDIRSPTLRYHTLFSDTNNPTAGNPIDLSSDEEEQLYCTFPASPAIPFNGPNHTSPPVTESDLLEYSMDMRWRPRPDGLDWTDMVEIEAEFANNNDDNDDDDNDDNDDNDDDNNADNDTKIFRDDIFAAASSSAASSASSSIAATIVATSEKTTAGGWAVNPSQQQSAWSSRLSELSSAVKNYAQYVSNDPTKTLEEIKTLLENIRPDMDIPPESREGTPDALVYPLMEHQKVGLTWMKKMEESKTRGGILADDVRFFYIYITIIIIIIIIIITTHLVTNIKNCRWDWVKPSRRLLFLCLDRPKTTIARPP